MREKEGEERWNKSSFWNQKLISKETNFKKFTFEETVCYVGMSELLFIIVKYFYNDKAFL